MKTRDYFPLLHLILPASLGVLLHDHIDFKWSILVAVLITLLTILFAFKLSRKRFGGALFSGALFGFTFCIYALVVQFYNPQFPDLSQVNAWQVTDRLTVKDGYCRHVCYPISYHPKNTNYYSCVLTIKSSKCEHESGQLLRSSKPPIHVQNKPELSFDLEKYYHSQGVGFQLFLQPNHIQVLDCKVSQSLASIIKNRLVSYRFNLKSRIEKVYSGTPIQSLINALLLGDRSMFSKEEKERFATLGIAHVLAVSGMHLGLVFLALNHLLKPLKQVKVLAWIYVPINITAVWSFAILTGFSPSVKRAAFMLSCFLIGKAMSRSVSSIHILSLSYLVLLFNDPLVLNQLGFQLSFLAIFGILTIGMWIDKLLILANNIYSKLWSAISVSASAQFITAPLIILRFGSISTWFLLSNLIIVPLIVLLLYLGWLTVFLDFIWPNMVSFLIEIQVRIYLIVQWMGRAILNLPIAKFDHLEHTYLEVCFIYCFIFLLIGSFFKRGKFQLLLALIILGLALLVF